MGREFDDPFTTFYGTDRSRTGFAGADPQAGLEERERYINGHGERELISLPKGRFFL